jgi:hypothetical protein
MGLGYDKGCGIHTDMLSMELEEGLRGAWICTWEAEKDSSTFPSKYNLLLGKNKSSLITYGVKNSSDKGT